MNSACGEIIKVFDIPKEIINDNERQRRVYSCEGIAPSVLARADSAKIIVGAAMRGRYNKDGKIEQQLELRNDKNSNAITTVQKDSLVVENFQKPPMN